MPSSAEIDIRPFGRGSWALDEGDSARPALWLLLARSGSTTLHRPCGPLRVEEGTVLILSCPERATIELEGDARAIVIRLHCDTGSLPKMAPVVSFEVCQGTVSGVFAHVLNGLAEDAANGVEYRCQPTHRLLVGLVRSLCLDEARLGESRAPDLFGEATDQIEGRLWDSELDADDVARMLCVSTRTLHRAFRSQGATLSGWIREQRLERCRDDLVNPRYKHVPISKVAARWGIPDAAHFSRLFKLRYGVSPRAFRSCDGIGDSTSAVLQPVPA